MVPLLAALLTLVPPDQRAPGIDARDVLRRAGEYAKTYHAQLRAVVADEHYVQRSTGAFDEQRTLRSEFMIVRGLGGREAWLAFRDVLEVDGREVGGSRGRLEQLLKESGTSLAARTRALAADQAKYNLGDVFRTINVPTLPLEFLLPDEQRRFRFRGAGTATVDEAACVILSYEERQRPTFIRTPDGDDVVAKGSFWIEPSTGRIWRTELRTDKPVKLTITVTYGWEPKLSLMVPRRMDEAYITPTSRISAEAAYSNYRRFETEIRIR